MNPNQRHKTSVFSEYQNNSNNSISSKQLQYWLLQMAPTSHTSPKFHNNEWNLTSISSRYETDGMTFGQRMDTFESANKENMQSRANLLIENNSKVMIKENHNLSLSQKQQKLTKSKSYINAMQQLQKRAKTLEQQNCNMRKSLQLLKQQKRQSMQSSMVYEQEMKSRLFKLSQSQRKIQELKRENKKLRDGKNEQSSKIKLMEKAINEQKLGVSHIQERLDTLSIENQQLKKELEDSNNMAKSLLIENKQLATKAQTLQNMKEKSTNSILQKYAKALEKIEEMEMTINQMRNKNNIIEERHKKILDQKDSKYLALLERMNAVKLEKEQLSFMLQNHISEVQQKGKLLSSGNSRINELEKYCSEVNKQLSSTRAKNQQFQQKYKQLENKYNKLQLKYQSLQEKLKNHEQLSIEREKKERIEQKKVEEITQNEQSINHSSPQQRVTKNSELIQQPSSSGQQQNTPVEKYDHFQPEYEQQTEDFTNFPQPLSIIVNAKVQDSKIKTEHDEKTQAVPQNESEDEQDTMENAKYKIMRKVIQENKKEQKENQLTSRNGSRKSSFQKKTTNKAIKRKSNSKQSKQSKEDIKQNNKVQISRIFKSPKQPNINIRQNQSSKGRKQNYLNESFQNRSKSSSVEKKSVEKKSNSVDSKRQRKEKDCTKTVTNKKPINQQQPSSHSRFINQASYENGYDYQSAQPNRYPDYDQEHYYYTNEINKRQNYEIEPGTRENYHSFHHSQSHSFKEETTKQQLKKAMLLEYQEEALKLYEEHERLLAVSENQNITNEERAEILGRIRQVMLMIDHNTEKIFTIKGKIQ